ncbi:MAG: lysophospholipid acyltransferase family protein [Pirellula sp.]|jgi:1-acyl-sn-glycerol-3-phosphate acyltransferase
MNIQPYRSPDQHWPPKMTPWWFFCADFLRTNALRKQQMQSVELRGLEHLKEAMARKQGILLAPNHSFHWDSYCLLEAARATSCPFYFMTAWQVFHQSNWFDRISMQRCGCFSVDREGSDMQSMKTAIDILQSRPHPLVIFPEGDVYHTNDCITPFRDGAAAIALMAARKAERDVVVIPVAIKRWYLSDPSPSILNTLSTLETRLYWEPKLNTPIPDRILQIADGLLSLKELEHFQTTRTGPLPQRIRSLANDVLARVEAKYGISLSDAMLPERVKEVRRRIIHQQSEEENKLSDTDRQRLKADMDTMFFVTQLYSYPGDYMTNKPSVERIAETVDKLEEDVLGAPYPSVRGPKRAVVQFAPPIQIPKGKEKKLNASDLTEQMHANVQGMLDALNAESDSK